MTDIPQPTHSEQREAVVVVMRRWICLFAVQPEEIYSDREIDMLIKRRQEHGV